MQVYVTDSLTSACTFPLFFPVLVVTWLQHYNTKKKEGVCGLLLILLATTAIIITTTLPTDKHSHGQRDANSTMSFLGEVAL